MSSNIICVTTFRQGNIDNPVKRVRAEVFLDTAKKSGTALADNQTTNADHFTTN